MFCWSVSAFCGTTSLFHDRSRVDQPLAIPRATPLLSFVAAEAAKTEQPADFGAGGVHFDGGLLRGEPPVMTFGHGHFFLTVQPSANISPVHFNGN
jgi:hypothetical protein